MMRQSGKMIRRCAGRGQSEITASARGMLGLGSRSAVVIPARASIPTAAELCRVPGRIFYEFLTYLRISRCAVVIGRDPIEKSVEPASESGNPS